MSYRPGITDEDVLKRWMGIEITKMNEGIVADRKSLLRLLREDIPSAMTKKGGQYFFNMYLSIISL
jgi:uncharacterized protein (UPF0216 family)